MATTPQYMRNGPRSWCNLHHQMRCRSPHTQAGRQEHSSDRCKHPWQRLCSSSDAIRLLAYDHAAPAKPGLPWPTFMTMLLDACAQTGARTSLRGEPCSAGMPLRCLRGMAFMSSGCGPKGTPGTASTSQHSASAGSGCCRGPIKVSPSCPDFLVAAGRTCQARHDKIFME